MGTWRFQLQVVDLNLRGGRLRPRQAQLRLDLQRALEIHPLGEIQLACQSPARGGPGAIQPHVEVIVATLAPRPQTQIHRSLQNHIPDGIQRPVPGADATLRDGHSAIAAAQRQLGCGQRIWEGRGAHLQPAHPQASATGRTSITPLEAQIAIQTAADAEIVAGGHQSRQAVQHQPVHPAVQIEPRTIPVATPFEPEASLLIAPAQAQCRAERPSIEVLREAPIHEQPLPRWSQFNACPRPDAVPKIEPGRLRSGSAATGDPVPPGGIARQACHRPLQVQPEHRLPVTQAGDRIETDAEAADGHLGAVLFRRENPRSTDGHAPGPQTAVLTELDRVAEGATDGGFQRWGQPRHQIGCSPIEAPAARHHPT